MGLDNHRLGDYHEDHVLFQYATVPKGRNLILRTLMLLPAESSLSLLALIIRRLDLFALPTQVSYPMFVDCHT